MCIVFIRAPVVDTLGSAITSPKLEEWEIKDQKPRALLDIAVADTQPSTGNRLSMFGWTCIV